jgi:hypothetical protein
VNRKVTRPSGMAAPHEVPSPAGDGRVLDLIALAKSVCSRYYEEFTDEDERYGDAGRAWCVHDNQHLLNWAALDAAGSVDLDSQVAWLARVLEARDFPLDRLARNLDLGAAVVRDDGGEGAEAMAQALEGAARMVRERGTFLGDRP